MPREYRRVDDADDGSVAPDRGNRRLFELGIGSRDMCSDEEVLFEGEIARAIEVDHRVWACRYFVDEVGNGAALRTDRRLAADRRQRIVDLPGCLDDALTGFRRNARPGHLVEDERYARLRDASDASDVRHRRSALAPRSRLARSLVFGHRSRSRLFSCAYGYSN